MSISSQIEKELKDKAEKIDNINFGKITFIVQNKKIVRVEIQEGWTSKK